MVDADDFAHASGQDAGPVRRVGQTREVPLALLGFFGRDQVGVGSANVQVQPALDASRLCAGVGVEEGDLTVEGRHRNLPTVRPENVATF